MFARFTLDSSRLSKQNLIDILRPDAADPKYSLRRLEAFIHRLAGGFEPATLSSAIGRVKATATLTFTDDPAAAGALVVCGVTFTARASGATTDEWNITSGGTAAADAAGNAASVAALVNLNATTSKCVLATSALGVVTFTAVAAGAEANGYVLSESLTNCTAVNFTGGDNGTVVSLSVL